MRRLTRAQRRAATAAPRPFDGFVSRRVTVDGIATHLREANAVDGTAVVLLHGLAVSHRYLIPTARALAARHPVCVPDLPGFGLSGTPPWVFGPAAHARHVAALLTRPVVLVGHSFGAEVAARLAATRPDLVRALVLAGPSGDPAARSRRGQVGRLLADLPWEDPRQVPIIARDVRDAGPRRILRTLRHSVHNRIEDDLVAVTAPTLLLRGTADRVTPPRWLRRAAALVGPTARVREIPGAGHNALTTAGVEAARAVIDFVARVER